jgi:glycosyltransferase involved in cell wall biosynthesis
MKNNPRFNYIITIHNKQELIRDVLLGLLVCCRDNSHIYTVLDGCTDNTESIIDEISCLFSQIPITKVYTPDVHEILSINAGLKAASQEGEGYNILLQDDVILRDFMWEAKVSKLYEWAGDRLGFVSFRLGFNLTENLRLSEDPFIQQIENAYGHGLEKALPLFPGQLVYRDIVIKSPVCIPFKLVRDIGMLDERLAPYMCDDFDYSIRCLKAGYHNAVFGLRFQSDVDWGSTRKNPSPQLGELQDRNLRLIEDWHKSFLESISSNRENKSVLDVPNIASEYEKNLATKAWDENRKALNDFFLTQGHSGFMRKDKRFIMKNILFLSEVIIRRLKNRQNWS